VIDEDDNVVNQVNRQEVHQRGLLHRGVHVLLVTRERRLLVQKRGKQCKPYPGALDCSVSEHVKAGERYEQAAMRGMEEEMGVRGVLIKPLVKFRLTYSECDEEISVLYEGEIDPGMVRYDPEEVEAIRYDTLAELMEKLERGGEEICSWFEEILRWYAGKPVRMKIIETYAHSHNRMLR